MSLRQTVFLLVTLISLCSISCRSRKPVLVLRRRTGVEDVKFPCSRVPSDAQQACLDLGKVEVLGYEEDMITAFITDQECKGILIKQSAMNIQDIKPDELSARWSIDFSWQPAHNLGGDSSIRSDLFDQKTPRTFVGEIEPVNQAAAAKTARLACSIIHGRGGTLVTD